MAMGVHGRNSFHSQELDNGMLFELRILTAFHFDWHWTGVLDSCVFKVMYDRGEISRDCVEPFLSSFRYSNKSMTGGQTFLPVLVFPAPYTDVCYAFLLWDIRKNWLVAPSLEGWSFNCINMLVVLVWGFIRLWTVIYVIWHFPTCLWLKGGRPPSTVSSTDDWSRMMLAGHSIFPCI
jgi:hypothetical protein